VIQDCTEPINETSTSIFASAQPPVDPRLEQYIAWQDSAGRFVCRYQCMIRIFRNKMLGDECGHSVSFNEPFGKTGGIRRAPRPLERWRKTIEAQPRYGKIILVRFFPLNLNSNHFTLRDL